MKKLILILATLACFIAVRAQTSTIDDYPNSIKVNYDNGASFSIKKDLFNVEIDPDSTVVSIVSAQAKGVRDHKAYLVLDPEDFGYTVVDTLYSRLHALLHREYDLRLVYDGSGNNDTVYYEYNGTPEFISVMTYSGTDLATQKYVTQ